MVERVGTANVDNRHGLRDPQEHPSINDVVQRSPREHYDPNNDPSDTSTTDTESGDDSSDSEQEAAPTSTQQVRRKRRQRQRLINDAVHKGYLVNPSSYPRGLGEWSWLQTGVDDTAALTLNLTTPGEVTKARQENDPRIPHGIGPDQTPVVIFEPDHRFLNPDELPEGHGHLEYYSESAAEKAWLDYGGNDEYDFENINRPTASEIWAIRQASENFARDIDIVWIPQDGENDTEEENATEDEQYHKEDSDSNYGDAELTDGDFEELQSISPVRKSIASKKDPSGDGPSKYFSSKGVQMVQKRKRDPDSPSKSRREEFKEKYRRRDSSASNDDIDVDIPRIQSSPQSGLPHDAKATQVTTRSSSTQIGEYRHTVDPASKMDVPARSKTQPQGVKPASVQDLAASLLFLQTNGIVLGHSKQKRYQVLRDAGSAQPTGEVVPTFQGKYATGVKNGMKNVDKLHHMTMKCSKRHEQRHYKLRLRQSRWGLGAATPW
ncbi:hypothetical protein M8818_007403 [Zalaria obscura]|uniref:Uncharacterized protein n=1 Tax=Zalaria obscura TaxID=2024903 RepID=A0ACC3S4X5_9PEZI